MIRARSRRAAGWLALGAAALLALAGCGRYGPPVRSVPEKASVGPEAGDEAGPPADPEAEEEKERE